MPDPATELQPGLALPLVHGTAELAHRAYAGAAADALFAHVDRPGRTAGENAALALDIATACQLTFRREQGLAIQAEALGACQLFRVAREATVHGPAPLRLLALMRPGDLMANAPLDFITRHLNVQLDLLYLLPGAVMPAAVPDHDVLYVGGGNLATLGQRLDLFRHWPRPVLNHPARVDGLARDSLAAALACIPGVLSPSCVRLMRQGLTAEAVAYPALVRPVGSHAGADLAKLHGPNELAAYLQSSKADEFYVTAFVDYHSEDGLFRKYRVAMVDGAPFLCHMGVSEHWMVHYLSAGMSTHADRREDEARAMAEFETGFAARHGAALAALHDKIGLDYVMLDCAEAPDGRLLVFEADAEAIVHLMDPPDLFPYKPAPMRRLFAGFEAMLRRRALRGARLAA